MRKGIITVEVDDPNNVVVNVRDERGNVTESHNVGVGHGRTFEVFVAFVVVLIAWAVWACRTIYVRNQHQIETIERSRQP